MNGESIWQFPAGLGIFIYGMFHLEDALKKTEDRAFKLYLKKHTKNKSAALTGGLVITGILQSSSVVNLILLSFVGAGLITMRNALAVLLGSNIGGTLNSWLVAVLGFTFNLGSYAMAIIAVASAGLLLFRNRQRLTRYAKFAMGIGLLLFGLDLVKASMQSLLLSFDFSAWVQSPRIVMLLFGFAFTAVIQTSAATVMVVLAALNQGILNIETSVAVVLGSELGTTVKIVIGAMGGNAAKKRVAAANVIFNLLSTSIGFAFLRPITGMLLQLFSDPLLALVAFQSTVNILGAIISFFFLGQLGALLEKYFDHDRTATTYLQAGVEFPATAVDMLDKEVRLFLQNVMRFNAQVFRLREVATEPHARKPLDTHGEAYLRLKRTEGEVLAFYSKMNTTDFNAEERIRVNELMGATRNAMYSAKGMKDVYADRKELSNSGNDHKYVMYQQLSIQLSDVYKSVYELLSAAAPKRGETAQRIMETVRSNYETNANATLKLAREEQIREAEISTLFNLNREIYSSEKALLEGVSDYLSLANSKRSAKQEQSDAIEPRPTKTYAAVRK